MLYDPKWEKVTDPVSIEGLIQWMEHQDPSKEYNFDCVHGGCLIGMYYAHLDNESIPHTHRYSSVFNEYPDGGYGVVCAESPRTIGAALSRARALLTDK